MSFQLFSRQSLLLVISFFMCLPLCSCGGIKVDDLRCEYLKNPLAIDNTQPHFSWKMTSRNNGAHSTAYQILVATEIDKLNENQADLWNSGKVEDQMSSGILYAGAELSARTHAFWKVRV